MMKKNFIFVCFATVFLFSNCSRTIPDNTPYYKYKGKIESSKKDREYYIDREFDANELLEDRKLFEEGAYNNGRIEPLVPDAETAFKLAYVVMTKRFGEERVKREIPFFVYLRDNLTWCIWGKDNNGRRHKGEQVMFCYINRLNAKTYCYIDH